MSKRGISLVAAVFLVASFLVTGVARAQTTFIARL